MTVIYSADVATAGCGFLKLLLRWRGSIYKLLKVDFFLYVMTFYSLALIYRFVLTSDQQTIFYFIAEHCHVFNSSTALAFVLGFFINLVMQRWNSLVGSIPSPDRMAMFVTANIRGHDDKVRLMRRTIMRYLCLSYLITLSSISPVVKKKFPKFKNMVEAGFMLENELQVIENIDSRDNKYFVPIAWCTTLLARARLEGKIKDESALKTLIDEVNDFRGKLGGLFTFDWAPLPLVYTQVVTIAVYSYFIPALICKQFRYGPGNFLIYQDWFPIFTFLEYFFYVGWLKVGESFINPFGKDDDDVDFTTLIDRNLRVSYLVVDDMHSEHPELIKDQYWETTFSQTPGQEHTSGPNNMSYLGSALDVQLKESGKHRSIDGNKQEKSWWRKGSKASSGTDRQNSANSDKDAQNVKLSSKKKQKSSIDSSTEDGKLSKNRDCDNRRR
ncbi:hypothetical protein HELRODRAFT_105425 [Helobdella robusta]|uniref:Bestrophin homolog n=1 Tax=Helobdella robusta TaxID=6412 RepID=T1EDU8_HELRO|nr:hypothetical protein HELRODRAFT_105425 [Helobdella robusta]ESO12602.1 hypothetical protein HELRODRAFT_105425 [Helobdella robusta]